jgi:hypothetical protein
MTATIGNAVAARRRHLTSRHVGNSWSQARVRPSAVVMRHPFLHDRPDMSFIHRDYPIQALAPHGADHAITDCVGLRASHRRLQHCQAHCRHRIVNGGRIDAVAVVNQKALWLIAGHNRAKLLDRPRRRRMRRHVPMDDPAGSDVQDHEHLQRSEHRGDDHEEITREHDAGMVAHERAPSLDHLSSGRSVLGM